MNKIKTSSSDVRKIERILENANAFYECMGTFCTPILILESWHICLMIEKAMSSISAATYDVELPVRELNELRSDWYRTYLDAIPTE